MRTRHGIVLGLVMVACMFAFAHAQGPAGVERADSLWTQYEELHVTIEKLEAQKSLAEELALDAYGDLTDAELRDAERKALQRTTDAIVHGVKKIDGESEDDYRARLRQERWLANQQYLLIGRAKTKRGEAERKEALRRAADEAGLRTK